MFDFQRVHIQSGLEIQNFLTYNVFCLIRLFDFILKFRIQKVYETVSKISKLPLSSVVRTYIMEQKTIAHGRLRDNFNTKTAVSQTAALYRAYKKLFFIVIFVINPINRCRCR